MKTGKNREPFRKFFESSSYVKWALLTVITILFTLVLSPNLVITEHTYQLGDVAERDIKAPKDFLVEDTEATEANRKRAAESILTVYDHDAALSSNLTRRVAKAFADFRKIIAANQETANQTAAAGPGTPQSNNVKPKAAVEKILWKKKESFEEKLGIKVSKGFYTLLIKERFSKEIPELINRILVKILENGVVANKEILLREAGKGIVLRTVGKKKETEVHALKHFYGLDQAKAMVRIIGQPLLTEFNPNVRGLVVDFCQKLIQPNITLNKSETEERRKQAAAKVTPTLYQIKAGEMLLREGERVTEVQLLKQKMLQGQVKKEQLLISSIGAAMVILCLLMTTYVLCTESTRQEVMHHNKHLLFITVMLMAMILLSKFSATLSESMPQLTQFSMSASSITYGIPIASGAMAVCLFLGLRIAIPFAIITAVCAAMIFQNQLENFLYFMISGSMAAYWMQNCRERKVFIKAGLKLGILNVILATAISVYKVEFSGFKLLWDISFGFLGGVGSGIIASGIAPLLEIAFGYTTDITLLELANLDRPILRKLMIEAPGTYHHSVIVGSMVEAAAAEIGANPLLAKVCGYYHDIGKLRKPLYFIENQNNGKNKHDKLAPSMSSLILISHIKEGVEIAKENKLGQVIIDTIRQHHGTSLIRYFYEKAKQQKGESAVNIDNFRYPGPKPQTREAGLVMLADVVEAASRALENPTPSRIQGLVQNLTNKIFSDGQLNDCELTLKDLHSIAKSFNTILYGIHHHRIEYSEGIAAGKGKGKNGSADRQQAKQHQDIVKENEKNGTGHLRRLGLS
ncbi:MAG: HDIG domain-containing protein [Deltaproteobacteria bacterium]|nr:HDIG domain-containing protein [Deltaproteobacteria bacterium]